MCQATVYMNGEKIMEEVTQINSTPEGIRLKSLFEGPKFLQAEICEIDLLKHRVYLEKKDE